MVGGFIDMEKFNFCGETIESLNEMLIEETIQGPELSRIHTIYPNIVTQKEIGFIGEGSLVGVGSNGCDPVEQEYEINTRVVKWDPKEWEIRLKLCYSQLQSAATVYSLKTGVDIPDFTETDYMKIVLQILAKSVNLFTYRLFWFNALNATKYYSEPNKDSTHLDQFLDSLDMNYFNILDGFWYQIWVDENNTDKEVNIPEGMQGVTTENGEVTSTTNIPPRIEPENMITYLSELVNKAPLELRSASDRQILMTQNMYDAYLQYLITSCCLESARTILLDGTPTVGFMGIPIIPMPIWDKMLNAYQTIPFEAPADSINFTICPFRAVFTTKSNLGIGVDSLDSFANVKVWYEKKDRLVYVELMGKADAKIINPEMLTVAYTMHGDNTQSGGDTVAALKRIARFAGFFKETSTNQTTQINGYC